MRRGVYVLLLATFAAVAGCAGGDIGDGASDAMSEPADAALASDAAPSCDPIWRTALPQVEARDLAFTAGRVYAAGGSSDTGWVGALSMCTGTLQDSTDVTHAGSTDLMIDSLLLVGDELFAAGSLVPSMDPLDGLYARVATDPLAVELVSPLYGSEGEDRTSQLAATGAGNLWMVGTVDSTASPGLWGIKADTDGATCGFAGPATSSYGRGIAANNDDVFMFGDLEGHGLVAHYDDTACTLSPCPCVADWTESLQVGTQQTVIMDVIAPGSALYAVGFALDTGAEATDLFGFAVQLNPANGSVVGTYRWDPTTRGDGFTGAAHDGINLYVVGGQGWDGDDQFAVIDATVHKLPSSLNGTPTAEWISSPSDNIMWKVEVEAGRDGALFAVGLTEPGTSVVMRCDKDGTCP